MEGQPISVHSHFDINALLSESVSARTAEFAKRAEIHFQAGRLSEAITCIDRAWLLAEKPEAIFELYKTICIGADEFEKIRYAHKRLAFIAYEHGEFEKSLIHCQDSINTHAKHRHVDHYEYDHEILFLVRSIAHRTTPERSKRPATPKNRKYRLVFLMHGIDAVGSVVVKIVLLFARHVNTSKFEVAIATPENEILLIENPQAAGAIKEFRKLGCKVIFPTKYLLTERLSELSEKLHDYHTDIIVSTALLADLTQYFVMSTSIDAALVGIIQGPPPQFAAQLLDWSISWSKHSLIDCPTNCSLITLETDQPLPEGRVKNKNSIFPEIPDTAKIILSAGRFVKFQSKEFWIELRDLILINENWYLLIVGLAKSDLPFFGSLWPADLEWRIKFIPWTSDFQNILFSADLVIDTYPSGGGIVLTDAMSFGIPCISFQNDYSHVFDQTDWNPAEEFIPLPELVVPRGDYAELSAIVKKLLCDQCYYNYVSSLVISEVKIRKGNPERMVRSCEEVFIKAIESRRKAGNRSFSPSGDRINSSSSGLLDRLINLVYHFISTIKKVIEYRSYMKRR